MARTNAGADNQFALSRYGTEADLAARNAAARTATSATNAGAGNQFALARYGTEADLARTNAGAANTFALSQFQTDADLARSNSALELQRQFGNMEFARAGQNDQFAREFQLAAMYQAQAQDPYQMVLGRSGAPAMAQSATGQGSYALHSGARLFDPWNSEYMNILAGNQANELAARTATANNRAGLAGGLLSGLGSIGSAAVPFMF